MSALLCPLHLLLFGKPLTYDLIYRRFHKARRNRFLVAPTLAIIWNECLVDSDIRVELVERLSQFATILSGKLFVIQETVDVFDPVTSTCHDHFEVRLLIFPLLLAARLGSDRSCAVCRAGAQIFAYCFRPDSVAPLPCQPLKESSHAPVLRRPGLPVMVGWTISIRGHQSGCGFRSAASSSLGGRV